MTSFNPFISRLRRDHKTVGQSKQSWVLMVIVSGLLFGGLAQRLVYLQLVSGQDFRDKAERNRVQTIPRVPGRGSVIDRQGRLLAGSQLAHSVSVWRTAINRPTWPRLRKIAADTLGVSQDEIQKRADRLEYETRFLVPIAHNVPPEQVTRLLERGSEVQGIQVDLETTRHYPNGETAAHLLGYVGEISKEEFESKRYQSQRQDKGYRHSDIVGKMGLEKSLEFDLRGKPGKERVEIDGKGNLMQVLDRREPLSGQDLRLTLDLELQRAAERALAGRRGAVVMLRPSDGAILAMASAPGFDPNLFTRKVDEKTWAELQKRRNPFLNRALQGFAPASTFKVVTAVSALESGRLSPDVVLPTYPYLSAGGTKIWDWNKAGFGPMGFVGAMAFSSNTFYGQVGLRAGEQNLIGWARKFGFGQRTGVELIYDEAPGLIADNEWKLKRKLGNWHVVDTINSSIGQGYVLASPLQVAVMFAAIANGGYKVRPHLVDRGLPPSAYRQSLNLKPSTLDVMGRALRAVVTYGTGQAAGAGIPGAAGKSGTAEDPPRPTHAWFGGYAPMDKPEVVAVAFLENGGGGGKMAGPVVRSVLAAYFEQKRSQKTPAPGAKKTEPKPGAKPDSTRPGSPSPAATPRPSQP